MKTIRLTPESFGTIQKSLLKRSTSDYPKQEAAAVALKAVSDWFSDNRDYGMAVIFCCYDKAMRQYYINVINAADPQSQL